MDTRCRWGRASDAVPPLRRAVELDPDDAEAYNNLGIALTQAARSREAVEALQSALALQPDYPEAHYKLAHAFASGGQSAEAAWAFRDALLIRPDWVAPLRDLALLLATHPDVNVRDGAEATRPNTMLGLPGTVQERLRDIPFAPIATATNQQN